MKVIEAISDTNIGGAGILLVTRLKHSDRKRIHTTVLLPENSALKKRLEAIQIPVLEINGCADRSLDWSAIIKCCAVFRKIRPDLVNCHGCLSARIAAKICRVPSVVYTRHCVYPLKAWQTRRVGRWVIGKFQEKFCHTIIAVADAAKKNLTDMGVSSKRIHVIINGVDGLKKSDREERDRLMKALTFPTDSFVVGICARLEPCKGHLDFLKAAKILLNRSDRYRFLIVGDGSIRQSLEAYCKENNLSEFVRFVGFRANVAPYVNLFHLQANCSIGTETSSLALSEGMSLGLPTVASDFGGNPHMVRDGVNGLLYPVSHPIDLADRIHTFFLDHALYARCSEGAVRRFREEFNAEKMTRQTESLYWSCYSAKN